MYDMEVIITNVEYRELKQGCEERKGLKERIKVLEGHIWDFQKQIKDKDESLDQKKKQVKQLSRNVMGLSKRVLVSEEVLGAQEEKWVKRQRELLENMLNAVKVKQQVQQAWKKEKLLLQSLQAKHKESLGKIDEMERKKKKQSAQWNGQKNKLEKQIKTLNQKLQTTKIQALDELLSIQKQMQALALQLSDKQNAVKQALGVLQDKNAHIDNLTKKVEELVEELEKKIKEKEEIADLLTKKSEEAKSFEILNRALNDKILEQKEKIKKVVEKLTPLSKEVHLLRFSQEKIKQTVQIQQKTLEDCQVLEKIIRKSLQNFDNKNIFHEKEKEELKNKVESLQKQNQKVQKEIILKTEKYNKQMKELEQKIREGEHEKEQYERKIKRLDAFLSSMKEQLYESNEKTVKLRKQSIILNEKIQQQAKLLTKCEELKNTKDSESEQMTTQVFQIQRQTLYQANRASCENGRQFKEDVDSLWHSIENFMEEKKEELETTWDLKQIAGQIISQQFKLMMKRFSHNFEQKYGQK